MLNDLKNKADLIFVGGFAMFMHGLKSSYNDIDVVVKNLEGIENCTEYTTDSKFSKSCKRAYIESTPNIDIFIESELPEFKIINGLKVQTVESMRSYYQSILPLVSDYWKSIIKEKLKAL